MVTTNEQLNNALARNDSEFEIFQKMDDEEEEVCERKEQTEERREYRMKKEGKNIEQRRITEKEKTQV